MLTIHEIASAQEGKPRLLIGPDALGSRAIAGTSKGHVLVVDDEDMNRSLLKDCLEASGYEISEAPNGIEAMEMIAKALPDVVLLDVMMPKMDGFEVCRRIRATPWMAHVPILLVTALSERKERLTGIAAGANDFLTKPIDMQEVLLRVTNSVQRKHLHDRLAAEQAQTQHLLLSLLPARIAARMMHGELTIADYHPETTVLSATLAGFASLIEVISPEQVVWILNEIFSQFDDLAAARGVERIKSAGDRYLIAGGLEVSECNPAVSMVHLAREMRDCLRRFNDAYNTSLRIKIGISTGPVVAGVIGRQKIGFDIWGQAVNEAAQLEILAAPDSIRISDATYALVNGSFAIDTAWFGDCGATDSRAHAVI